MGNVRRGIQREVEIMSRSSDRHWRVSDLDIAINKILTSSIRVDKEKRREYFDLSGKYEVDLFSKYLNGDMTVLDFGGGIGRVAKHVAPLVKKVYVSDISEGMLELGRDVWCKGIDNIEWVRNTNILPFDDETFDFVYSLLCLWHLIVESMDLTHWVNECVRVLKPEGWFWYDMDFDRFIVVPGCDHIATIRKYDDGSDTICKLYRKRSK